MSSESRRANLREANRPPCRIATPGSATTKADVRTRSSQRRARFATTAVVLGALGVAGDVECRMKATSDPLLRLSELGLDAVLTLGDNQLHVLVRGGQVSFPVQAPLKPRVVLEAPPEVFAELFAGYLDLDSALASGEVRLEGPKREARRFFEMFRLPAREPARQ